MKGIVSSRADGAISISSDAGRDVHFLCQRRFRLPLPKTLSTVLRFCNVKFRLIDSHLTFSTSWFLMKARSQKKNNVYLLIKKIKNERLEF
jgi:hypothetical protein